MGGEENIHAAEIRGADADFPSSTERRETGLKPMRAPRTRGGGREGARRVGKLREARNLVAARGAIPTQAPRKQRCRVSVP